MCVCACVCVSVRARLLACACALVVVFVCVVCFGKCAGVVAKSSSTSRAICLAKSSSTSCAICHLWQAGGFCSWSTGGRGCGCSMCLSIGLRRIMPPSGGACLLHSHAMRHRAAKWGCVPCSSLLQCGKGCVPCSICILLQLPTRVPRVFPQRRHVTRPCVIFNLPVAACGSGAGGIETLPALCVMPVCR